MSAKFTVYRDKANQFRFNLKAANGEIIAVGESYPDKKSCLKGIASIQKNAPIAKIVDSTEDASKSAKSKAAKPKAAKPKAAKPMAAKPKASKPKASKPKAAAKPKVEKPKVDAPKVENAPANTPIA